MWCAAMAPKKLPSALRWEKRLPRKPYDMSKRKQAQCERLPVSGLDVRKLHLKKAAAAPAADAALSSCSRPPPADRRQPEKGAQYRLTMGRTPANLLGLLQTRLLADCDVSCPRSLLPTKGLTCTTKSGALSLILGTFSSRGGLQADVAPVLFEQGLYFLRPNDVYTIPASQLQNAHYRFRVCKATKDVIELEDVEVTPERGLADMHRVEELLADWRPQEPDVPARHSYDAVPLRVVPASARGHKSVARTDKRRWGLLLDVPQPRLLDMAPHRCLGCSSDKPCASYFPVKPSDVLRTLRDEGLHRYIRALVRPRRTMFFTDRFLAFLLRLGRRVACVASARFCIVRAFSFMLFFVPVLQILSF